MAYKDVTPPAGGKITITNGILQVPDQPVIPFIRGDGTGPDIWAASVRVFDAAVGGLGGCPYAPGAPGNVATEAVAELAAHEGFETGIDHERLARAAMLAQSLRSMP